MTDTEAAAVIQTHAQDLRKEVESNATSQRTIFRMGIIGLAAIIALRKDLTVADVQDMLPIFPLLGMAIVAFTAAELTLVFRLARALANTEVRINALAKRKLLTHDQDFWEYRRRHFFIPSNSTLASIFIVVGVLFVGLEWLLLQSSELNDYPSVRLLVYLLAAITHVITIGYYARSVAELRVPMISESDTLTEVTGPIRE